eukprot:TRINITY_DN12190_c0_g2_i10.p1 TRINITY_DN12190_c0_g2~~TRINITY_DN12190_c0_g2_i10.p1  ORF type:complete len:365 (-),score=60.30 TRINITY_DN12190_c0_g2_i10:1054-2148(-)
MKYGSIVYTLTSLSLLLQDSTGLTVSNATGSTSGPTYVTGKPIFQDAFFKWWARPLPTATDKYTRIFRGEDGGLCDGTVADVDILDAEDVQSQESIEIAVAEAIVNTLNSTETLDAALDSAVAVLEVLATAVGKVKARIESSAEGCWGIAFGRATARAFANGTVTAIANAISSAVGPEAAVEFDTITQDTATNVSEVIDTVAALVGVGNGSSISMERQVLVEAKVNVMACALARAYATVKGEEAKAVAVASTGCQEAQKVTPKSFIDAVSCRCRNFGDQPQGCGQHGVRGAQDFICYVANPLETTGCRCAQSSTLYPGQAWRYCGIALSQMQVYLNTQDNKNGILPVQKTNGYCGDYQPGFDLL